MKSRNFRLLAVTVLLSAFVLMGVNNVLRAQGFDISKARSVIFDGVERVYIYVHYVGPNEEGQQQLPAPLRQKNIEDLLLKMYSERFSPETCADYISSEPYGCNNQPVEVKPYNHYWSDRFPESKQPGTLNVVMQVRVNATSKDIPEREGLYVPINLINDRSDSDIVTRHEITFPYLLRGTQSDEWMQNRIENFIKSKIR